MDFTPNNPAHYIITNKNEYTEVLLSFPISGNINYIHTLSEVN